MRSSLIFGVALLAMAACGGVEPHPRVAYPAPPAAPACTPQYDDAKPKAEAARADTKRAYDAVTSLNQAWASEIAGLASDMGSKEKDLVFALSSVEDEVRALRDIAGCKATYKRPFPVTAATKVEYALECPRPTPEIAARRDKIAKIVTARFGALVVLVAKREEARAARLARGSAAGHPGFDDCDEPMIDSRENAFTSNDARAAKGGEEKDFCGYHNVLKCFPACSAGDEEACALVGTHYTIGQGGLEKDAVKAAEYHARACELALENGDDKAKRCHNAFLQQYVGKTYDRAGATLRVLCKSPTADCDSALAMAIHAPELRPIALETYDGFCAKNVANACELAKKYRAPVVTAP